MFHLDCPKDQSLISFKSIDIIITSSKNKIYLIGQNKSKTKFSILGIKTLPFQPLKELIYLVQNQLTSEQLTHEMSKIVSNQSNYSTIKTQGIIGFIKFLQGYYLIYIQSSQKIAKIGKHKIRVIKKTNIIPLFQLQNNEYKTEEKRYLQMLKSYKLENYYFCYSYDLTNSLFWNLGKYQKQGKNTKQKQPSFSQSQSIQGLCEIFQWNYNLVKQFNHEINNRNWVLPIIHGFARHMNVKTRGSIFSVIIICRRSRHHAGTRYIKRGINQQGFVANFVQTQQIVVNNSSSNKHPNCSSFIQIRGSAPVYWMQQPNFVNPKPAIQLVGSDPMFLSTKKHFGDLISHYGRHIFCVNLMKTIESNPRQTILSGQYSRAIALINQQFQQIQQTNRIHYMQTDFKANQKINKQVFVEKIKLLAYYFILNTGINQCKTISKLNIQAIELQNGVIRANCVDCLDRTNSFQQLVGQTALSLQIAKLMNQQINLKTLTKDMSIFENYGQIFQQMGDLISIQYGSSLAHKQQLNKTQTTRFEFMTSMTRHINNTFNDNERQQQIDLFLQILDPSHSHVWDYKPHITLFPNQKIRQKVTKYWQRKAYYQFIHQTNIEAYNKTNTLQKSKLQMINTPNIELLTRQDLVFSWSNHIADEMYTNLVQHYKFYLQYQSQQFKQNKRIKSKISIKKALEDKMNQDYCKYKRKSSIQIYESHFVPFDTDQNASVAESSNYFNSILQPVPVANTDSNMISLQKLDSSIDFTYLTFTHPDFDEYETIQSIKKYQNYMMIEDQVIFNDVQLAFQNVYDPDVQLPYENKLSEEQIIIITHKINTMDYISQRELIDKTKTKSPQRRQKRRTLFSPIKIITLEDKKTQVLEELIKKNFSHGCKVGKIRII